MMSWFISFDLVHKHNTFTIREQEFFMNNVKTFNSALLLLLLLILILSFFFLLYSSFLRTALHDRNENLSA